MQAERKSTIDSEEVAKFSAMADEWWDEKGKFRPLHKFNPSRIGYIRDKAIQHFNLTDKAKPLSGLSLLDIGCGGGLLSEPLCRLGASVTGIDASGKNINIAKLHAGREPLPINYLCTSVEEMDEKNKFDIVLAMEVIEHVANVEVFMKSACSLVKPGGLLIIATLNRTLKSLAFAKIGAEYILGWLPKGTHNWRKFLTPGEIDVLLRSNSVQLKEVAGMSYNPLKDLWAITSDPSINYILLCTK